MASRKRKQQQDRERRSLQQSEGGITKYFRVASFIDDAASDHVSDYLDTPEESHVEPPAPSPQFEAPSVPLSLDGRSVPLSLERATFIRRPVDADTVLNDLGLVIKDSMPDSEVSTAVSGLNAGQKYSLLTNHYKPGQNFIFPKTFGD